MSETESKSGVSPRVNGFPDHWEVVKLGDLTTKVNSGATPKGGKDSYKSEGTPLIRSMNVHFGGFREKGVAFLDDEQADGLRNAIVEADDVLLNITGASIGRVTTAPEYMDGARVNQHVCIVRTNEGLTSKFLSYFLSSPTQQAMIMHQQTGATRQALTKGKILAFGIPVPPLPEQKRIVAKIEELFSDLDAGVSALERARANLCRYRASVLKSAVEGRLTQKWRSANPGVEPASELLARILRERRQRWEQQQLATYESKGKEPPKNWQSKYKEPVEPDERNLPDVPGGWAVASMDQLTEIITSGSRAWSKYYGSGTGTFIMAQNVRPGRLDLNFRQPVNPPEGDRDRIRSQVNLGDLLVTIVGANTGDVCRVPEELPEHYVCQSVALMRPVDARISNYLETYFVADEGAQKQFEKYIYGAGRPHLSFDQLKMTAILLPPLKEQHAILEASDSRFPSIDHTDAMLKANMAKADRLRQSILKSAFEGNLTAGCLKDEMSG